MEKRIYRSCNDRVIAGVCGGLADYLEVDPAIVRLIFVLALFLAFAGPFVYVIAWLIIPLEPSCESKTRPEEEIKEKAEQLASEIKKRAKGFSGNNHDGRIVVGLAIAILGLIFLLQNLTGFNFWHNLWPLILIAVGFFFIVNNRK